MLTDAQLVTLVALGVRNMPPNTAAGERERWIYFAVRRGAYHHDNDGWGVGDSQLESAIVNEIAKVQAFLAAELGTGANSLGDRTPAHLDLADACRARTRQTAAQVKPLVTAASRGRTDLATKIAIRALAAHSTLWSGSDVNEAATREMIDRRLRMVERMTLNVNGGDDGPTWTVSAPDNWTDGYRTRIFEYPYLVSSAATPLLTAATRGGVTLPLHAGGREDLFQQTSTTTWDWLSVNYADGKTLRELLWDEPPPWPEVQTADDPDAIAADHRVIVNARLPSQALRWCVQGLDQGRARAALLPDPRSGSRRSGAHAQPGDR